MAGRDLRALFSSNDPHLTAAEAFTNRQEQWNLAAAALAEHLQHVTSPGFSVADFEAPRTNVLVFHGVGGIGKTTLSRTLEAALAGGQRPAQWGEPAWPAGRLVPVRIDLARSAGIDFERIVLTIRLALGVLGRPLPAFDIALRRYWEQAHPGQPLEEYLRRDGLAARFGRTLPQQMQSVLADVAQAVLLPGTVGSAAGQVAGALVKALRERRQSVRALAACPRLADLLEAEPDLEALSFYPHLLAWELTQLDHDGAAPVVPVILLDTFEDIGDRTHRDMERLLQRVVWLMPNAFFIITGRSRPRPRSPGGLGRTLHRSPRGEGHPRRHQLRRLSLLRPEPHHRRHLHRDGLAPPRTHSPRTRRPRHPRTHQTLTPAGCSPNWAPTHLCGPPSTSCPAPNPGRSGCRCTWPGPGCAPTPSTGLGSA